MDLAAILVNSLWSALFATGWRLFFPLRLGRWCQVSAVDSSLAWARDLLMGWGASQNLATFLAAALVLFIAVRFVRRPGVSPIVMVAGVIPLGAAGALFRAIVGFLQVLSLKGEGLSAPVALIPIQAFCLRRRARLLWERGLDISLGNPLAGIRPSNLTGTLKS